MLIFIAAGLQIRLSGSGAAATAQYAIFWKGQRGFASLYSGMSSTVTLRAACAPMTSTWAMSAVFDGPLMKVP